VAPLTNVILLEFRVTPVTLVVTVTEEEALIPPRLGTEAVIVVVPFPTPSTLPALVTVAMAVFAEDQVFVEEATAEGNIVAVMVRLVPTVSVNDVGDTVMEEDAVIVTTHCAVLFPSAVVTVIVAEPTETAVTRPL
jgi:hypothetical protein